MTHPITSSRTSRLPAISVLPPRVVAEVERFNRSKWSAVPENSEQSPAAGPEQCGSEEPLHSVVDAVPPHATDLDRSPSYLFSWPNPRFLAALSVPSILAGAMAWLWFREASLSQRVFDLERERAALAPAQQDPQPIMRLAASASSASNAVQLTVWLSRALPAATFSVEVFSIQDPTQHQWVSLHASSANTAEGSVSLPLQLPSRPAGWSPGASVVAVLTSGRAVISAGTIIPAVPALTVSPVLP